MNDKMRAFLTLLEKAMDEDGADYNSQDVKFVRGMIPHHEMAVSMAEKQISKGGNKFVVGIAKDIKKAQTAEIDVLSKWLDDRDLSPDGGM